MKNKNPSHTMLEMTTSLVVSDAYLTCMKNSTTRVALITATTIATATFMFPRSTKATATVMTVSTMSAPKIARYRLFGTTCSSYSSCSVNSYDDMVSVVPVDQIEQWKEENPDDIHEVPVQPEHLDRRVPAWRERTLAGHVHDHEQQCDADDHVQRVHPGQREIQNHEHAHLVRHGRELAVHVEPALHREQPDHRVCVMRVVQLELRLVLDVLDAEEHQAEQERPAEVPEHLPLFSLVRRVHGQRHRERGRDQHGRVDAAENQVELPAGGRISGIEPEAVDHVRGEHPAEEHDLLRDEHPHAQAGRRLLLPERVEVMLQPDVPVRVGVDKCRVRQLWPPCRARSCVSRRSQSASDRN